MIHQVAHLGNGLLGMQELAAGSVHLALVDPPTGQTKAPWDKPWHTGMFWEAIDHCLADDGVCVVFAPPMYFARLITEATPPRRYSYDLVWRKNRKSGHLNANRAPLRGHETIHVWGDTGRGPARYRPQFTYGHEPMSAATRTSKSELYGRETVTTTKAGTTHRYQDSVLEIDCVANDTEGRIHSSQKPVELLRWLIRAYARPGELVVDPSMGSGATLQAARLEGRRGHGWEIHRPYYDKAVAWLEGRDTPLFASAGATP